jgi:hypothetical protein
MTSFHFGISVDRAGTERVEDHPRVGLPPEPPQHLAEACRELADAGQADFCAVVVNDGQWLGVNWADLASWPEQLRDARSFWGDRRRLENDGFVERHGARPAAPRPRDQD